MIRLIIILSLLIGAPVSGFAQTGNVSGATVTASGSVTSRTLASRAGDVLGTKDYGAICDGSHHTISTVLGVSTVAGLAAYTNPVGGGTPYSWINNGQWAAKVALPMSVAATSGATTLYFDSALQVPTGATVTGTQIAGSTTVSAVSNPGTVTQVTNGITSTIGTKSITVNSGTATPVGSHPVPQTGLSADDYVVSSTTTNVTLKYGITAASIASATTLTFQPPSSVVLNNAITANKPSVQSAVSTASVNYWVYFAWPLTDAMVAAAEMDWLGSQAAIEAATAAPNGGRVQLPSGSCIMDNATVSGNTLGGLVIHENTGGLGFTAAADLIGNGLANTYLTWPSEMGAGRVALSHGVPYATFDNGLGHYGFQFYYGSDDGFTLVGPAGRSDPAVGTVATRTWGIVSGARRELNNVAVYGFYVGATFENIDHTRWSNVFLDGNAMGLRVGPAGISLYANNAIDHLELSGSSLANLSLDKSAFFLDTDIHTLYCGYTPKCIRLEPGATDNYGQPTGSQMSNSIIDNTNAENLGVGFIVDDNFGPIYTYTPLAGGEFSPQGLTFTNLGFSYDGSKRPAGSLMNLWLQLGNAYGNTFNFVGETTPPFVSGMKAAIYIDLGNNGIGGNTFIGGMSNVLSTYGTTSFVLIYGSTYAQSQYSQKFIEPNAWTGHIETIASSTGLAAGTPTEYAGGASGSDLAVQRAGGSGIFAGINMTGSAANPAGTAGGDVTIVATRMCGGGYSVAIPTSGTATANHQAKLATGGTITNSAGFNTAGEVIIGTIMQSSAGTARVNIGSNGSCD